MPKNRTCFSIGYQGRSIEELCAVLLRNDIKVLVDVRERAWSMRAPYRKTALRDALARAGIDYLHLREAGNPFRPARGVVMGFAECARKYARHLRDNPSVVDAARKVAQESRVAFFCYEGLASECHRSVLLSRMLEQSPGLKVKHL